MYVCAVSSASLKFLFLVLFTHLPEYTSISQDTQQLFTPFTVSHSNSLHITHFSEIDAYSILSLNPKACTDTETCPWLHRQKEVSIFLGHFFNPGGYSVPARSSSDCSPLQKKMHCCDPPTQCQLGSCLC